MSHGYTFPVSLISLMSASCALYDETCYAGRPWAGHELWLQLSEKDMYTLPLGIMPRAWHNCKACNLHIKTAWQRQCSQKDLSTRCNHAGYNAGQEYTGLSSAVRCKIESVQDNSALTQHADECEPWMPAEFAMPMHSRATVYIISSFQSKALLNTHASKTPL